MYDETLLNYDVEAVSVNSFKEKYVIHIRALGRVPFKVPKIREQVVHEILGCQRGDVASAVLIEHVGYDASSRALRAAHVLSQAALLYNRIPARLPAEANRPASE